jgi:hypothetical protein
MAVVSFKGITAYFPGVTCRSDDPETIRVELGHPISYQVDAISFYLAAFLGPVGVTGNDPPSFTSIVVGHRPGIQFTQAGMGSITVDPRLKGALAASRTTDAVDDGTLTFDGTDSSHMKLDGSVSCGH